jgi:hypothetical protein
MLKAMLFVDADWLCTSTFALGRPQGKPDWQLDHRRLGGVLADEIGRRHHLGPIDVVRSHYFARRLDERDPRDPALAQYRRAFLANVQGEPHLELELVDLAHGEASINRGDDAAPASPQRCTSPSRPRRCAMR